VSDGGPAAPPLPIPRVLHQLWIGPRPRPARLMDGWRAAHPGWAYELWDDARCAAFGFRNAAAIGALAEWNGRADVMRYEILERHGGVFVDADAEALRPLDDGLRAHDSFAAYESERLRPGLIACGVLGACRGNRLMRLCMHAVAAMAPAVLAAERAWRTVGPGLLTRVVADARYTELRVYPAYLFYPEHYTGAVHRGPAPPYARQHWGSTRANGYDRLR